MYSRPKSNVGKSKWCHLWLDGFILVGVAQHTEVLEYALVTCPHRGVTQGGLGAMGPWGHLARGCPARNFAGICGGGSIDHRLLNRHVQQNTEM
jgi:hypothetical protein